MYEVVIQLGPIKVIIFVEKEVSFLLVYELI